MKTLLLLFTTLLIGSFTLNAQNPIWSVAPDYLDMEEIIIQSLPIPYHYSDNPNPAFNGWSLSEEMHEFLYYHGQSASAASNAYADANGDLLFFIKVQLQVTNS